MSTTMTHRMDTGRARPTRVQIVIWAAVMLLTLALALYDWNGYQVGTYGDDGSYVTMTDSLLARVPYGTLLFPGEERTTQFPFLFPLMLAPVRALLPDSLDALRIVPLTATLLALGVLFWGWRWIGGGLDYWWGTAVFALTALSPITILHARTVMSEAPFLLFSLLLIVWVERAAVLNNKFSPSWWWGVILGVLLVLVIFTRTIGWIVAAVWLGYLLWKCGRSIQRQIGLAVLTGALLLAMVLVTTTVRPLDLLPQEYLTQFNNTFDNVPAGKPPEEQDLPAGTFRASNQRSLLRAMVAHLDLADKLPYQMEVALTEWTDANGIAFLRYLPGFFGVALWTAGMVAWWRKTGLTAFQAVVIPYLALLFLWAWNGARLFYPVQSQLLLGFLLGLFVIPHWIVARAPVLNFAPRLASGMTVLTCVVLAAGCVWLDVSFTRTMLLPGDQYARAARLNAVIPPDAIVLSTRATTDHLYLKQTFIDPPTRLTSSQELAVYMQRQAIDYVVSHAGTDPTEENSHLRISMVKRFVTALDPLIKAGVVETVLTDPPNDLAIYRVNKEVLAALSP